MHALKALSLMMVTESGISMVCKRELAKCFIADNPGILLNSVLRQSRYLRVFQQGQTVGAVFGTISINPCSGFFHHSHDLQVFLKTKEMMCQIVTQQSVCC